MFNALSKCETIERVWFKSCNVCDLSPENLQPFLNAGHNLVFVVFEFLQKEDDAATKNLVSELLTIYEKMHPARFFRIKDVNFCDAVPSIHFEEMAFGGFEKSKISVLDPYENFLDF